MSEQNNDVTARMVTRRIRRHNALRWCSVAGDRRAAGLAPRQQGQNLFTSPSKHAQQGDSRS